MDASQLNHPNIVEVLTTVVEAGQGYIVMEYVPGGSLADLLHNQPRLPLERALAIYATHFLFTPLGMPVNLIAAGSSYPYWRFLVFDVAGTLSWLVLYGGLG